jgi:hypothetical protein
MHYDPISADPESIMTLGEDVGLRLLANVMSCLSGRFEARRGSPDVLQGNAGRPSASGVRRRPRS